MATGEDGRRKSSSIDFSALLAVVFEELGWELG